MVSGTPMALLKLFGLAVPRSESPSTACSRRQVVVLPLLPPTAITWVLSSVLRWAAARRSSAAAVFVTFSTVTPSPSEAAGGTASASWTTSTEAPPWAACWTCRWPSVRSPLMAMKTQPGATLRESMMTSPESVAGMAGRTSVSAPRADFRESMERKTMVSSRSPTACRDVMVAAGGPASDGLVYRPRARRGWRIERVRMDRKPGRPRPGFRLAKGVVSFGGVPTQKSTSNCSRTAT